MTGHNFEVLKCTAPEDIIIKNMNTDRKVMVSYLHFQAPESNDIPSVVLYPSLALCLKPPTPPTLHPHAHPSNQPPHSNTSTFLLTH